MVFFETITSIRKVKENKDFYDLHVPEKENYLAQGIYHHNSGKDNTVAKIFVYYLYWTNCLRNPQAYFGQGKGSEIALGNTCISGIEAKRIFFKKVKAFIRQLKDPSTGKNWFEETMGMDLRQGKDVQDRQIETPKRVTLYSLDSQRQTGVGKDMLVAVYDEIGGFRYPDAEDLSDTTTQTQLSRFPKFCKRYFISFKRDDNDFMMVRYRQMKRSKIGPAGRRVWCSRRATWEVNIKRTKQDFAEEYRRNPEKSKRVYECKGRSQEGGYFKIHKVIRKNVNRYRSNPIIGNAVRVRDIKKLKFHKWFKGVPSIDYFMHADLAKGKYGGDCAGISLCHGVENMPVRINDSVRKYLHREGIITSTIDQTAGKGVFIDLMLQFKAKEGYEIMFDDIVNLIVFLHNELGFTIKSATYDGWQSTGEIQRLKWKHDIEADMLSVDRNNQAHDTTKGLIYQGLLDYYYNIIFLREAEELIIEENGKVNHPEKSFRRDREEGDIKGSKDVWDSVAGNCLKIMGDKMARAEYWFGDTMPKPSLVRGHINPEEYEKQQQTRMTAKARENAERLKIQTQAEPVYYGQVPVPDW